jgi:uridine phosphorylase
MSRDGLPASGNNQLGDACHRQPEDHDVVSGLLRPTPAPRSHTDEYAQQSVFTVEGLLDAAIRQKGIVKATVPACCILDPDGDLVRYLVQTGQGCRSDIWPCYHSDLTLFTRAGQEFGVVGCAVGASYAVLVAEELFALGCELLVSITSAGLLDDALAPPFFLLIEKALRDEGTSYHYLPPATFSILGPGLHERLREAMTAMDIRTGISWTTDAPFRETPGKIARAKSLGAAVVEMEAAALYAFAQAKQKKVVCFAHVTNRLATAENDFDKGENNSSERMIELALRMWQAVVNPGQCSDRCADSETESNKASTRHNPLPDIGG